MKASHTAAPPTTQTVWLAIERVDTSPQTRNSRRVYDRAKLRELADSIRQHGILQPILVTPVGDRFKVIAASLRP